MSLDTYANLKTSIENWSHRTDVNALLDDFIDIAESEMWKRLKIRDMEARATASASTSDRFLALPDSFIQMRRLTIINGSLNYEIVYKTPESMTVQNTAGRPKFFTVTTQLEFERTCDSAYTVEMSYVRSLTALSSSNTSNAVLTRFPNVYLYGSLWALFQWAHNIEKAEYWWAKFLEAIEAANKEDRKGRYGSAPAMRIEGSTP